MRCVNQNGGYLCIPRTLYNQPYRPEIPAEPEPVYPGLSTGFSETFLPSLPGGGRSVEPSYPRVRTTAQCILGYTPAEDGTCNGESEEMHSGFTAERSTPSVKLQIQQCFHYLHGWLSFCCFSWLTDVLFSLLDVRKFWKMSQDVVRKCLVLSQTPRYLVYCLRGLKKPEHMYIWAAGIREMCLFFWKDY